MKKEIIGVCSRGPEGRQQGVIIQICIFSSDLCFAPLPNRSREKKLVDILRRNGYYNVKTRGVDKVKSRYGENLELVLAKDIFLGFCAWQQNRELSREIQLGSKSGT